MERHARVVAIGPEQDVRAIAGALEARTPKITVEWTVAPSAAPDGGMDQRCVRAGAPAAGPPLNTRRSPSPDVAVLCVDVDSAASLNVARRAARDMAPGYSDGRALLIAMSHGAPRAHSQHAVGRRARHRGGDGSAVVTQDQLDTLALSGGLLQLYANVAAPEELAALAERLAQALCSAVGYEGHATPMVLSAALHGL